MKREPQKTKFNFQILKEGATSPDREVRKNIFIGYFEQFQEFPSYLFDNSEKIDAQLLETIQDLKEDPETPAEMRKGIATLLARLPGEHDLPATA